MSYIYVITNDINGKQYVGKTNWTIEKRFKEHLKDRRRAQFEKRPLYNAMNKYGIEHFSIEQLEECDESVVNDREIYWIKKLDTYKNGYNATLGGDSKHYYNYQEIANKYLELGTIYKTAQYFNCDRNTVSVACRQCGVEIETPQDKARKNSKPVAQLDKETEKIIAIYSSIGEATKAVNGNHGSISKVCNGKAKTASGYKWRFI